MSVVRIYNEREIKSRPKTRKLFFSVNPLSDIRLPFACRRDTDVLPIATRMKNRLGSLDSAVVTANDQARVNVEELMEMRGWTQAELAEKLGRSQPWLSKRLTGTTPFQIEDLDLVGDIFGLSPAQLLQSGYGKLDRRGGQDRRSGADRRQIGERFQSPRGRHRLPHHQADTDDDDHPPSH